MAGELLRDTDPLVTLLDRSQRNHEAFVHLFNEWDGDIVSTEAVLTEATHLLGRIAGGREACIEFFLSGGSLPVPTTSAVLRRSRDLIRRYSDQPMDYADATLVVLAEDLNTTRIFTTDWRDFSVYRIRGRRRFDILPELF